MATRPKELLRATANDYSESLLELDSKVSDKNFDRGFYIAAADVDADAPFKKVRDTAIKMGMILEEDESLGTVKAMIKGGAANMAPVLLVAIVGKGKVDVGAYSREGLIRQHAAKKTAERFMGLLRKDSEDNA